MDTIYALASARGKAGVAVLRLSGPGSHAAVAGLCGPLPEPRRASLRRLVKDGVELDQALVILFPEGESFTGEAAAELHLHGSLAVVHAVMQALAGEYGLRLAEPGEFTRRALENGKLDLAQVEGLADLIEAETEAQRRQALRVLSGAIGRRAEEWREKLIRAAALIEATIDFADEDVPVDVAPEVLALGHAVLADLRREALGGRAAERIRDGFEVAIIGAPNAGKSTLLNALAGREAADGAGSTLGAHCRPGSFGECDLDRQGRCEHTEQVGDVVLADKLGAQRVGFAALGHVKAQPIGAMRDLARLQTRRPRA